jgi:hypothetical protein
MYRAQVVCDVVYNIAPAHSPWLASDLFLPGWLLAYFPPLPPLLTKIANGTLSQETQVTHL